ncbi:TPA: Cd(II)/Pb(II)-responsive transcriptional regulator, partial [Klebsiella pneumoniae]|nr:Cd(II)/Pb(II)-responsive transcriptional regulator [Klebsiella pneumoniae]
CSGSRSVEACGILQGLGNCHGESATNSQTSG